MNAWTGELGDLRVRSVALPRDGGVLNPANRGRYSMQRTDVAATWAAERQRMDLGPGASVRPRMRYERAPTSDQRASRGDDFSADAWLDQVNKTMVWCVVGYDPNVGTGPSA